MSSEEIGTTGEYESQRPVIDNLEIEHTHMDNQSKSHMIAVDTQALKDKLNARFTLMHQGGGSLNTGLFNHLWDLKEKALMEHERQVKVPSDWLSELDFDLEANTGDLGRTHGLPPS
ncbi:MAG: hypothetical protein K2X70_08805 [Candidatus Obscuribacterales bacterium]|jgi:hypothetical protein|nr:hypothetical protein [Candidatus Obscuribacterales bacterium]